MSDNWLTIVPSDPQFVPPADRERAVLQVMEALVPQSEGMSIITSDAPELVSAGVNVQSVACPGCATAIDLDWWSDRVDDAAASSFEDLTVALPCCDTAANLNDLAYDWPQGFARWRLEVFNPLRSLLDPAEVDALRQALGHDVREIWTHI